MPVEQKQLCFTGGRKVKHSESGSSKFILPISRRNSHAISQNLPITRKVKIYYVLLEGHTWHYLIETTRHPKAVSNINPIL